MTTTLCANAQELQVSTTVEENAGDASACGSRAASSPETIAGALEKLQSAPKKCGIDRASTRPTAEGDELPTLRYSALATALKVHHHSHLRLTSTPRTHNHSHSAGHTQPISTVLALIPAVDAPGLKHDIWKTVLPYKSTFTQPETFGDRRPLATTSTGSWDNS